MRAYPVPDSTPNGVAHDAGIIIDSPDEFTHMLPHLLKHLQSKVGEAESGSYRHRDLLFTIRGLWRVMDLVESGSLPPETEMTLTPHETEAVHQRLLSDTSGNQEYSLGVMVTQCLASEYYRMHDIQLDNMARASDTASTFPQPRQQSSLVEV